VVDVFGLGDRRRQEQQVDAILQARPDLVIIAGGIDGGSTEAVLRLAETVNVACQLMETGRQPRVLYAGNSALSKEVARLLGQRAEVATADNPRPALETEDLGPMRAALASVYEAQRVSAYHGYTEVKRWVTGGSGLKPSATAFGRLVQFISRRDVPTDRLYSAPAPSLGVDLGSANTTLAAALNGRLALNVHAGLGVGHAAQAVLDAAGLEAVARWLPVDLPGRAVLEYVLHKSLYPATVPQTPEELHLEHALAREALRLAAGRTRPGWPASWRGGERGLLPWFDNIIASGAALGNVPRPVQAALLLLDGLELAGLGTLLLDTNGLAAALGAAAAVEPLLAAQVWDSGALPRLATFAAPAGARGLAAGQVAVRVKLAYSGGETANVEVPAGTLQAIPLGPGQTATVTLQPARGLDLGRGPGRSAVVRDLRGSLAGLIVDTRGRPLSLPADARARRDLVQKWAWAVEH
jgi:hypothetical protein